MGECSEIWVLMVKWRVYNLVFEKMVHTFVLTKKAF
jgi:hypothetical protein